MAKRVRQRDAAKERFWRQTIAEHLRSGLAIREFCSRRSVSEPLFYAWRRELARRDGRLTGSPRRGQVSGRDRHAVPRSEAPPVASRTSAAPRFVSLELASEPAATAMIEIVTRGGHTLRVPPGVDRQTLANVWAILEGPPC